MKVKEFLEKINYSSLDVEKELRTPKSLRYFKVEEMKEKLQEIDSAEELLMNIGEFCEQFDIPLEIMGTSTINRIYGVYVMNDKIRIEVSRECLREAIKDITVETNEPLTEMELIKRQIQKLNELSIRDKIGVLLKVLADIKDILKKNIEFLESEFDPNRDINYEEEFNC